MSVNQTNPDEIGIARASLWFTMLVIWLHFSWEVFWEHSVSVAGTEIGYFSRDSKMRNCPLLVFCRVLGEDWKSYAARPFLSPQTWCFLSHLVMHFSSKVHSQGKMDRGSSGCSPSESSKTSSCSYALGKRLLQLSCGSSLLPGRGLCQVLGSF